MEKRCALRQQPKENFVPLPDRQVLYFGFGHPFQCALVTVGQRAGKIGAGVQVHPLGGPWLASKIHNAAVGGGLHRQAGFLPHFAQGTGFGSFAGVKLAAHTDPFIVVDVVLLFNAVQHQIAAVLFQVAQSGLQQFSHSGASFPVCGAHKIYWYQYTTRIVQAARLQTMCGRLFGGQETNILKFTRRSVIISPKWRGL